MSLAALLLVAGTGFLVVSALGLLRFPDFWTAFARGGQGRDARAGAGVRRLVVPTGPGRAAVQLVLIAAFSLLVNPTAIHALARSAVRRPDAPEHRGQQFAVGGPTSRPRPRPTARAS
jgi:multicomponent Na+:H+ antiporter subunit G